MGPFQNLMKTFEVQTHRRAPVGITSGGITTDNKTIDAKMAAKPINDKPGPNTVKGCGGRGCDPQDPVFPLGRDDTTRRA